MKDEKIVSFIKKKQEHIHNIHEKKLNELHQAFENAFPLTKTKKSKNTQKKSKKKK